MPDGPDVSAYLTGVSGRAGPGVARRWDLPDPGPLVIGRAPACAVCLGGDPRVSRSHARLELVGSGWTLVDDGLSANGTFVNGRRITGRVRLHDRDAIRLGSTVLTFHTTGFQDETVADRGLPAVRPLTEAQARVLRALCRPYAATGGTGPGYPAPAANHEIAAELCLSLDAVKTHLRVLFHAFGIEDLPQNRKRARLAELAVQLGLVAEGRQ